MKRGAASADDVAAAPGRLRTGRRCGVLAVGVHLVAMGWVAWSSTGLVVSVLLAAGTLLGLVSLVFLRRSWQALPGEAGVRGDRWARVTGVAWGAAVALNVVVVGNGAPAWVPVLQAGLVAVAAVAFVGVLVAARPSRGRRPAGSKDAGPVSSTSPTEPPSPRH